LKSRPLILILVFAWIAPSAAPAQNPSKLVPPAANQPISFRNFGRPVGTKFKATMQADTHELRLDSSLTLTIHVDYEGPDGETPQDPPKEPILGDGFTSAFRIEDMHTESEHGSWTFACRLTPLSDKVDRIPTLLFTYFSPLGYQTLALPAIDIKVRPREKVKAEQVDKAGDLPLAGTPVSRLASGEQLLARKDRWVLPSLPAIIALLVLPPLVCLVWYRLWRQLFPDDALRLRRRRSRAARSALRGLDLARVARPDIRATLAASIVANYLKERLDLSIQEPTPRETAHHLERVGCSKDSVQRATEFFDVCDSARFAADASTGREHIVGLAEDLIQTLERGSIA
jgi:hypothetical protein